MKKFTPEEFKKHLNGVEVEVKNFIYGSAGDNAPRVASKVAIDSFKRNFENEGFEGKRWQEVKRRTPGTKSYEYYKGRGSVRAAAKILSGETGDLKESVENLVITPGRAVITSNKPYSAIHNDGGIAGRAPGFEMPKRQFMGDSPELAAEIDKELARKLKDILK